MGKLSNKLRSVQCGTGQRALAFYCPACQGYHTVPIDPGPRDHWTWNNDVDKPTFYPSVDVTSGHYMRSHVPGSSCWCTYNKEHPEEAEDGFECSRCHSFVKDGMISYLPDCTHALAGQTVPLGDIPDND